MKKAILIVLAIPVVTWLALAGAAEWMQRSMLARPWPHGLGRADSVPARYAERTQPTPAAAALVAMTPPLGVDLMPREGGPARTLPSRKEFDAIKDPLHAYLDAQLARTSGAIDAAPPAVAAYFDIHRAHLDAVRAHVLSGAPIAWKVQPAKVLDAPIPNLQGHMELARLFVARALTTGSWDDLQAVWQLDAGLRSRPDLVSQLIALSSARLTNAAAAKLPLQSPQAWLAELRATDFRGAVVASMQTEAYAWTHLPPERGIRGFVGRPYVKICGAEAAEAMRGAFEEMDQSNACDVRDDVITTSMKRKPSRWNVIAAIAMPNIGAMWQRATLMTPETELTEKVLQIRRGETPSASSRCSDGRWVVAQSSLKFSKQLHGSKAPLEFASLR